MAGTDAPRFTHPELVARRVKSFAGGAEQIFPVDSHGVSLVITLFQQDDNNNKHPLGLTDGKTPTPLPVKYPLVFTNLGDTPEAIEE